MRTRISLLAAALALLALAPAANAATTFDLGPGEHPDVAVDSNGTGHFVWDQRVDGANDVTVYCQVPRGATACAKTQSFNLTLESIGRTSYVFTPSANRVVIVSARCCTGSGDVVLEMESTDGGQTFSAPVQIGTADLGGSAAFGPGEAIFGGRIADFQKMTLGSSTSTVARLPTGQSISTIGSGGIFNGTTPVVAYTDSDNLGFSFWTGTGDPNDAGTWSGPHALGAGDEPRLAGGPGGLALLQESGPPGAHVLQARKFDGANFGAPVDVSETGDPIFADLSANPSTSELTALWVDNRSPNEWRIARSNDAGASWSAPVTLIQGDIADQQFNLQVSAAADAQGFAVSDQNSGTGHIVAAPLVPLVSGGSGGAGGDQPVDTVTVGGVEVSLIAPTSCVTPPSKVTLRVTSKIKKQLSPNKRVKITVAVFSVDKTKVTDKKAAFKGKFATTGFAKGSKHKLKALVTLKPIKGNGKAKKKTLKGALTICS